VIVVVLVDMIVVTKVHDIIHPTNYNFLFFCNYAQGVVLVEEWRIKILISSLV
jgi:hypothetical protein